MRSLLLALAALTLLLLAACHEQDQDRRIDGLVDYLDEWRADNARLHAEVAFLKARGSLHLVAKDGTDLGYSLGGNCAWNAEAGGEVCFTGGGEALFTSTACDGSPYFSSSGEPNTPRRSRRFLGPLWHVFKVVGTNESLRVQSRKNADGSCSTGIDVTMSLVSAEDTGIVLQRYTEAELSIELR